MSALTFVREDVRAIDDDMRQWKEFLRNPIQFLGQRITLKSLPLAHKIACAATPDVEKVVSAGQVQAERATEYERLVEVRKDGFLLREATAAEPIDKIQDVFRVRGQKKYVYIVGRRRSTTSTLQRLWLAVKGTTLEWRIIAGEREGPAFQQLSFASLALSPDGNRLAYWGELFPADVGPTGAQHLLVIHGRKRVASRRLGQVFFDGSSRHYAYLAMLGAGVSVVGSFTGAADPVSLGIDGAVTALPESWDYLEFKEFTARGELVVLVYEKAGFSQYALAQYRIAGSG